MLKKTKRKVFYGYKYLVYLSRHKKWILFDKYKRKIYLKFFLKKLILISIKNCSKTSTSKRYLSLIYLSRLPKLSSVNSLNNRCTASGRVWSTNKQTELCRFVLRNQLYSSNIPGFRRASW